MSRGNTVPPNNPIIIRPDISFFLSGTDSNACEKISEKAVAHETQQEGAAETAECAEDEVQACCKRRFVEGNAHPLHENLGRSGVCAYVDTYVAHYAYERKEYNGFGQ